MPCPFHNDDDADGTDGERSRDDPDGDEGDATDSTDPRAGRGIERRSFLKSALAIGGAGALSTTASLFGISRSAAAEAPTPSYADRGNRQHAWDAYEVFSEKKGTSLPPGRHVLLHLEYQGVATPTPHERETVRKAFDELEAVAGWGSDGLLFTVGYSASYFDRFDEPLPEGIGPATDSQFAKPSLLRPQTLIDFPGVTLPKEDPVADEYDCLIHMASSTVERLLAAELLLWGGEADIDGDGQPESLDNTLEGILETPASDGSGRPESYPYRRVGFAGQDNLEREGGEDDPDGVYPDEIPEDAKLSMGFNDLFKNSIPREDNVTLLEDQRLVVPKDPGPFAQGTVQHVSKLDLDLDPETGWYQYDTDERIDRMFSPDHDAEGMGEVADEFGDTTAITEENDTLDEPVPIRDFDGEDVADRTERHAREDGVVGHVEKTARARFDMETRITEEGQERLSGGDRDELLPAEEREDDLRGHDGVQESEQVMLRRDFDTVDQDKAGLHFVALMRFNPYMAYMRAAMNGIEFDTAEGPTGFGLDGDGRIQHDDLGDLLPQDGDAESKYDVNNNGIVGFTETERRGNYLIPPLTQRALPHPQATEVDISAARAGENYLVFVNTLGNDDLVEDLRDGSVRFGWYYDVNRARGAEPRQVNQHGNMAILVFPADETGIETAPGGPDGDVKVRLYAEEADTLRPVRGSTTVEHPTRNGVGRGRGESDRVDASDEPAAQEADD